LKKQKQYGDSFLGGIQINAETCKEPLAQYLPSLVVITGLAEIVDLIWLSKVGAVDPRIV
jgi:hypothetical protein